MFEPNRFDTDTCQELLEELCFLETKISDPLPAMPEEIRSLLLQPPSYLVSEGPWPFSSRSENWAS